MKPLSFIKLKGNAMSTSANETKKNDNEIAKIAAITTAAVAGVGVVAFGALVAKKYRTVKNDTKNWMGESNSNDF